MISANQRNSSSKDESSASPTEFQTPGPNQRTINYVQYSSDRDYARASMSIGYGARNSLSKSPQPEISRPLPVVHDLDAGSPQKIFMSAQRNYKNVKQSGAYTQITSPFTEAMIQPSTGGQYSSRQQQLVKDGHLKPTAQVAGRDSALSQGYNTTATAMTTGASSVRPGPKQMAPITAFSSMDDRKMGRPSSQRPLSNRSSNHSQNEGFKFSNPMPNQRIRSRSYRDYLPMAHQWSQPGSDCDREERAFIYPCRAFKQFFLTLKEGRIDLNNLDQSAVFQQMMQQAKREGSASRSIGHAHHSKPAINSGRRCGSTGGARILSASSDRSRSSAEAQPSRGHILKNRLKELTHGTVNNQKQPPGREQYPQNNLLSRSPPREDSNRSNQSRQKPKLQHIQQHKNTPLQLSNRGDKNADSHYPHQRTALNNPSPSQFQTEAQTSARKQKSPGYHKPQKAYPQGFLSPPPAHLTQSKKMTHPISGAKNLNRGSYLSPNQVPGIFNHSQSTAKKPKQKQLEQPIMMTPAYGGFKKNEKQISTAKPYKPPPAVPRKPPTQQQPFNLSSSPMKKAMKSFVQQERDQQEEQFPRQQYQTEPRKILSPTPNKSFSRPQQQAPPTPLRDQSSLNISVSSPGGNKLPPYAHKSNPGRISALPNVQVLNNDGTIKSNTPGGAAFLVQSPGVHLPLAGDTEEDDEIIEQIEQPDLYAVVQSPEMHKPSQKSLSNLTHSTTQKQQNPTAGRQTPLSKFAPGQSPSQRNDRIISGNFNVEEEKGWDANNLYIGRNHGIQYEESSDNTSAQQTSLHGAAPLSDGHLIGRTGNTFRQANQKKNAQTSKSRSRPTSQSMDRVMGVWKDPVPSSQDSATKKSRISAVQSQRGGKAGSRHSTYINPDTGHNNSEGKYNSGFMPMFLLNKELIDRGMCPQEIIAQAQQHHNLVHLPEPVQHKPSKFNRKRQSMNRQSSAGAEAMLPREDLQGPSSSRPDHRSSGSTGSQKRNTVMYDRDHNPSMPNLSQLISQDDPSEEQYQNSNSKAQIERRKSSQIPQINRISMGPSGFVQQRKNGSTGSQGSKSRKKARINLRPGQVINDEDEDDLSPTTSSYYTSQVPVPPQNTDLTYHSQPIIPNPSHPRSQINAAEEYKIQALDQQSEPSTGKRFLNRIGKSPKQASTGREWQRPAQESSIARLQQFQPQFPQSSSDVVFPMRRQRSGRSMNQQPDMSRSEDPGSPNRSLYISQMIQSPHPPAQMFNQGYERPQRNSNNNNYQFEDTIPFADNNSNQQQNRNQRASREQRRMRHSSSNNMVDGGPATSSVSNTNAPSSSMVGSSSVGSGTTLQQIPHAPINMVGPAYTSYGTNAAQVRSTQQLPATVPSYDINQSLNQQPDDDGGSTITRLVELVGVRRDTVAPKQNMLQPMDSREILENRRPTGRFAEPIHVRGITNEEQKLPYSGGQSSGRQQLSQKGSGGVASFGTYQMREPHRIQMDQVQEEGIPETIFSPNTTNNNENSSLFSPRQANHERKQSSRRNRNERSGSGGSREVSSQRMEQNPASTLQLPLIPICSPPEDAHDHPNALSPGGGDDTTLANFIRQLSPSINNFVDASGGDRSRKNRSSGVQEFEMNPRQTFAQQNEEQHFDMTIGAEEIEQFRPINRPPTFSSVVNNQMNVRGAGANLRPNNESTTNRAFRESFGYPGSSNTGAVVSGMMTPESSGIYGLQRQSTSGRNRNTPSYPIVGSASTSNQDNRRSRLNRSNDRSPSSDQSAGVQLNFGNNRLQLPEEEKSSSNQQNTYSQYQEFQITSTESVGGPFTRMPPSQRIFQRTDQSPQIDERPPSQRFSSLKYEAIQQNPPSSSRIGNAQTAVTQSSSSAKQSGKKQYDKITVNVARIVEEVPTSSAFETPQDQHQFNRHFKNTSGTFSRFRELEGILKQSLVHQNSNTQNEDGIDEKFFKTSIDYRIINQIQQEAARTIQQAFRAWYAKSQKCQSPTKHIVFQIEKPEKSKLATLDEASDSSSHTTSAKEQPRVSTQQPIQPTTVVTEIDEKELFRRSAPLEETKSRQPRTRDQSTQANEAISQHIQGRMVAQMRDQAVITEITQESCCCNCHQPRQLKPCLRCNGTGVVESYTEEDTLESFKKFFNAMMQQQVIMNQAVGECLRRAEESAAQRNQASQNQAQTQTNAHSLSQQCPGSEWCRCCIHRRQQ